MCIFRPKFHFKLLSEIKMRQEKIHQIFHQFFVAFLIFLNSSLAFGNKYAHLLSLSSINHYFVELISSDKRKRRCRRTRSRFYANHKKKKSPPMNFLIQSTDFYWQFLPLNLIANIFELLNY